MIDWAVPWTTAEIIDTLFLVVCCVIVSAVPLFYLSRANLRDPLARAIISGTGVTAFAFNTALAVTIATHAGLEPTDRTLHLLARFIYSSVAVGKGLFLIALITVLRYDHKRHPREAVNE